MNKYSIYTGFIFILLLSVCITQTRHSRKRYQKKHTPQDIHTFIDVNSLNNKENSLFGQQTSAITGLPTSTQKALDIVVPLDQTILDAPYIPLTEEKKIAPPIFEEDEIEDSIEFNFENAGLDNLVQQIQEIFEVTFISDDALQPLPQGKKSIKGNKITFKTNAPLSKKDAWNLFLSFLDLAGFAVVPHTDPKVFRITTIEAARKSPLPAYIGVDYTTLPDSDEIIRYVYFLENASTETIKSIIDPLRSTSSQGLIELKEHKGFMLTDKSYNIKMLMKIVKELDKVSIPESMAIIKLRNADAKQVQELYASLLPKEEPTSRFFTKKQPTSLYFPENTRIIAEPRTNTLVLLGPVDAIKKIETFIIKHIDVELDQAYSPLYTYQLKYADAVTIADIMTNVTAFGKESEAGKYGGVRGVDQYMRPMAFIPERETNKLIIKGYYEDYLKCKKIIDQLDEAQPQVAIEVLIASIDINNTKSLGSQLRSKVPGPNGLLGNNIKFQTSGLYTTSSIVTQPGSAPNVNGVDRLLGNLLNLVTGAAPGTTLIQLGADALGIWGIFQALQTITDAEILSNPFLLATNNTKATVALGEERRVVTSTVVGTESQDAFGADDANLEVIITPQINSDGMIVLKVSVTLDEFSNPLDQSSATKQTKNVTTNAIVANQEVLALGGLIRSSISNVETKVPVLGDIPILGWFFKNRRKVEIKQNILILISTKIIAPRSDKDAREFTKYHVADYHETLARMYNAADSRDPIHHAFFEDKNERRKKSAENFIFRKEETIETQQVKVEKEEPAPLPEASPQHIAQNQLLSTIRQKKRTELSLSQFLQDKEDVT
jgi:general secretion pathway protein D